jgi:hypothetical protein
MQWAAHSTQKARKMSSSANLDITKCRPSKPSNSPATHPSIVDPVSRRTRRHITRIIRVPTTAAEKRHPNGVRPNIHSPTAIIHFPTSGCTTMLGTPLKMPSVDPELMILSESLYFVSGLSTKLWA